MVVHTQYVARLVRKVPTTVNASNAECTQAVFKFMSADTDGDGCNVAQTLCEREHVRVRVVWQC